MLSNYTTYNSIRAVLGVSSRLFPDATLADEIYDLSLRAELSDIGEEVLATSTLDQDYLDIIDESASLVTTTLAFYNAVRLFAAHSVAYQSLTSLPEMSPSMISDSKATIKKNQADTASRVASNYAKFRRLLLEAYAAFLGVSAPVVSQPSIALVSAPDFDPITGV